jgi:hypothetical protein
LEEEGFVVFGVGNNDAVMGFGIRFHKSGKVEKRLVGCPTVVHNVHGGWVHGGEGSVGPFFF